LPELTPQHLNDVATNAIEAAPVADDQPSYPVLLFVEGIRFAYRQQDTFMRAVYERLPGDGYYVQVPGMFHADMTDVPLLASRVGLLDGPAEPYPEVLLETRRA
jgi:hypothetical protein